jgi:nucleoside-diphosphate-sugar epimerase
MKILITGGNGYIAQSIYDALKNEHDVALITRQDFDLTDTESTNQWFQDKHFDLLIHTAVVGGNRLNPEDESIIKSNLQMWRNLLYNQSSFAQLIQFGSGAELYAKDTPYGLSKSVIAESIKTKSNFTNIRIFAVFDKNELDRRFIKANIQRYINKESIIIHQDKYMDFLYMDDLISIIKFSILHPTVSLINCCYQEKYKLSDIANIINSLSTYKVPIEIHSEESTPPYTGAYADLGINFIGLEEGIKKVYQHLLYE